MRMGIGLTTRTLWTAIVLLWINTALQAQSGQSHNASLLAGDDGVGIGYSGDGGPARKAQLHYPHGITLDEQGDLFIADTGNGVIRKISVDGTITTLNRDHREKPLMQGQLDYFLPLGIIADGKGNIYLSDQSDVVWKVDAVHGTATLFAGTVAKPGYSGDRGPAKKAQLKHPEGLAIDSHGNVYIADSGNNTIRRVDTEGIITTVAGDHSLGKGYSGDGGQATSAQFSNPSGVAADDDGNLFVADEQNSVIRKIDPSGIIATVAGVYTPGIVGYKGDGGPANQARLARPFGIAVDHSGNLYIADTMNGVIRMVDAKGTISTLTTGLLPSSGQPWRGPVGIAVNKSGNVFIAYNKRSVIEQVDARR